MLTLHDKVYVSTLINRRREYESGHLDRVAKFIPRYDGPFDIMDMNAVKSTHPMQISNFTHLASSRKPAWFVAARS